MLENTGVGAYNGAGPSLMNKAVPRRRRVDRPGRGAPRGGDRAADRIEPITPSGAFDKPLTKAQVLAKAGTADQAVIRADSRLGAVDWVSARDSGSFLACGIARGELVHETPSRVVVGGVGTEEAFVAACQLLPAVGLEWFDPFVDLAAASLVV